VVLVLCGSFSPVTFLHLRMMEQAKDVVDTGLWQSVDPDKHEPRRTVFGLFSPVNDAYAKKGEHMILFPTSAK